jgi:hypothetical protein
MRGAKIAQDDSSVRGEGDRDEGERRVNGEAMDELIRPGGELSEE